jgi:hypothetical protein
MSVVDNIVIQPTVNVSTAGRSTCFFFAAFR